MITFQTSIPSGWRTSKYKISITTKGQYDHFASFRNYLLFI